MGAAAVAESAGTGSTASRSETFAVAGSTFAFMVVIVVKGKITLYEAPLCLVPADVPFQDHTRGAINSWIIPTHDAPR